MLSKSVLLLILSAYMPAMAETLLIYGEYETPRSDPTLYQPITQIAETLFQNSHFKLNIKSVPYGGRIISEVQRKRLDIFITGASEDLSSSIPADVIEIHPIPILDFSWSFFVRHDSGLTNAAIEDLKNYHLGANRLPVDVLTALLGRPIDKLTLYPNYDYLSKGLVAGRFDIMTGNKTMSNRAFRRLNVEKDVLEIGHAFAMNAHVFLRSSLPKDTKQDIFTLLDDRIPKLKQQGVINNILTQHDWH